MNEIKYSNKEKELQYKNTINKMENQCKEQLNQAKVLQDVIQEKKQFETDIIKLKHHIDKENFIKQQLDSDLLLYKNNIDEQNKIISDYKNKIDKMTNELIELQKQKTILQQQVISLQNQQQIMQDKLNYNEEKHLEKIKFLESKQEIIEKSLKIELENIKREDLSNQITNKELLKELSILQTSLNQIKLDNLQLKNDNQFLLDKKNQLESNVNELSVKLNNLKHQSNQILIEANNVEDRSLKFSVIQDIEMQKDNSVNEQNRQQLDLFVSKFNNMQKEYNQYKQHMEKNDNSQKFNIEKLQLEIQEIRFDFEQALNQKITQDKNIKEYKYRIFELENELQIFKELNYKANKQSELLEQQKVSKNLKNTELIQEIYQLKEESIR